MAPLGMSRIPKLEDVLELKWFVANGTVPSWHPNLQDIVHVCLIGWKFHTCPAGRFAEGGDSQIFEGSEALESKQENSRKLAIHKVK